MRAQHTHTLQASQLLDEWVEAQVICEGETKWANRLSDKKFIEKRFVLKHIRNKHAGAVDAELERIREGLYFDNFRCVCVCV